MQLSRSLEPAFLSSVLLPASFPGSVVGTVSAPSGHTRAQPHPWCICFISGSSERVVSPCQQPGTWYVETPELCGIDGVFEPAREKRVPSRPRGRLRLLGARPRRRWQLMKAIQFSSFLLTQGSLIQPRGHVLLLRSSPIGMLFGVPQARGGDWLLSGDLTFYS